MPGGRPKGARNKPKRALLSALKARYGEDFNPVMIMAEQAMKLVQKAEDYDAILSENAADMDVKDRIEAIQNLRTMRVDGINSMDKVAQYVEPRLKAVEVDLSNSDGSLRPQVIRLVPMTQKEIEEQRRAQLPPIEAEAEQVPG